MRKLEPSMQPETAEQIGRTVVERAAEIRKLAYEFYEKRGKQDGHALEDWTRAEMEVLKSEQVLTAA
jgi:hypothetical protein